MHLHLSGSTWKHKQTGLICISVHLGFGVQTLFSQFVSLDTLVSSLIMRTSIKNFLELLLAIVA